MNDLNINQKDELRVKGEGRISELSLCGNKQAWKLGIEKKGKVE